MSLDIEDRAALLDYLRGRGDLGSHQAAEVRVLPGGVSCRTVWVQLPGGEQWILKQALAKLRVQADWFSGVERIHREAAGLRWFNRCLPEGRTPRFVFEDHDEHVLAMTAVPMPHENWKQRMLSGQIDAAFMQQFGAILSAIHRSAEADPAAAKAAFGDQSFFETLRLEPYYAYSAEQVPQAADFLHALIADTRERRFALVHGDYSPKNVLIYAGRLVILDYEVIHIGDPAFDLGFSMTHLLSKALYLPEHRRALYDGAHLYWRTYLDTLGTPGWIGSLESAAVRHTLACLLARVAGRSPLEYLSAEQRQRQREIVLALIADLPPSVPQLIAAYHDRL